MVCGRDVTGRMLRYVTCDAEATDGTARYQVLHSSVEVLPKEVEEIA